MSMRIVTGRVWVVNCYIGAHPVCNKTFLTLTKALEQMEKAINGLSLQ